MAAQNARLGSAAQGDPLTSVAPRRDQRDEAALDDEAALGDDPPGDWY
jgi:hypothetical protein